MSARISAERKATYIAAFGVSLVAGVTAATIDAPWFVIAGAACVFFFAMSLVRLHWGAYALLLASMLSAIAVKMGPFTVRPDQVITVILAVACLVFLLSGKRPVMTTSLDWLILAYLFCNLFSSLIHAPDLRTSLQRCLLLAVTFSAYFVGTQLIRTHKILSNLISLFMVVGVLEAVYGIVSVYLITKGIHAGGAYYVFEDIYATGTFLEGNIFGSFEMMIGLILLSFLLSPHFRTSKFLILVSLVVVLIASLMSLTRAAWLGFMMGSITYVMFERKKLIARLRNHFPVLVIAFFLLAGVGYLLSSSIQSRSVSLLDLYNQRIKKIVEYRSGTGSARVQMWEGAFQFWQRNPIFGNGTDSIKVLARGTALPRFGDDYWIPNSLLLALHDTGLIGFVCFCAIQVAFLWNLRAVMNRTSSAYYQAVLGGFFAAFVGVQFAYFFTNAFWLVYIWVFMAIGTSCCRLAMKVSPDTPLQ